MKKSISIVLLTVIFAVSYGTKPGKKVQKDQGSKIEFINKTSDNRIDVMIDGKLFTSYCWPDNVFKPILYPVLTSAGTEITRGFPIKPKTGERADHPHHTGMWLTYGNVNGYDFWNNGSKGLGKQNDNGGVIKHIRVDELSGGIGEGYIVTVESWTDKSGEELLSERTEYHFIAKGSTRIIDRVTTLKAGDKEVSMPDTKEGMFGIRVARQLELASEGDITLYSADGHPEKVKEMSNEGISGNYRSSEGVTGLDVWGTRAKWMDLYGNIGDEKISLVICDHPKNPCYPTYWHARGYGLFSANPFGWNDFTKGKEQLNYSIPAGQSITFRYRVIISSGAHLNDTEINAYADDFARKYLGE
ncbi:MAG: PmoA family protein [Bacteroidetes bacterium]|nr:PmoA family protein [Bacteroidota bacterium]